MHKEDWEELLQKCIRALARRPQNQLAADVLEHLFLRQLGTASNPEQERNCVRAAGLLERTYRTTRQWKKLISVLQNRIDNCEDSGQKIELMVRMAKVYENEMKESTLAFGVLARAFALQPGRKDIRRGLEKLADRGERFEELVGIFLDAAEGKDEDWAVELRKHVARIFEHHLEDSEEAVRQWRSLLALRADDSEVLSALHRLEAKPDKRPVEHADVSDPPDLAEPVDEAELPILEHLYRKHQNYSDLLDVLRLRARKEPDPVRRKRLYYEVAELAAEKLGRPEDAVQAYLDLLAGDMSNLSAVKRLNRLYLTIEPVAQ
jgi:hypothetical protein